MRLIRVRLKGFCQHLDTTLEFGERLTALKGPIGSGKTNAVNGVLYALTGDLSRNHGVKADNICQALSDRETAFAEAEFEHAGVRAVVRRGLRPAGQSLSVPGRGLVLDKDREIRAELEAVLGVGDKILADYVFVEQWKIFDFLLRTGSETAQAFSRLFGLERAAKIYGLLGERRVEVPTVPMDIDVVRQRAAKGEQDLAAVDAELAAHAGLPEDWLEQDDPDSSVVRAWLDKEKLRADHGALCSARDALSGELEKARLAHREAADLLEKADAAAAASEAERNNVQRDLTLWDVHDRHAREKAFFESGLASARRELAGLRPPTRPHPYVEEDNSEWIEGVKKADARLRQLRQFTETFDPAVGRGECPTCLTPAADLAGKYEVFGAEAANLEACLRGWQVAWKTSRDFDAAAESFHRQLAAHTANTNDFEKQLAALAEATAPSRTREELDGWAARYADACRDYLQVRNSYREADRRLAAAEARWEKCLADVEASSARLDQAGVTREDFLAADARLAGRRLAWQERNRLAARRSSLVWGLEEWRRSLAFGDAALAARARAKRLNEHLGAVRAVFRHDGLPREVSQDYLESMRDDVNDVLEDFEASFRVVDVRDLRFVVRKHGAVLPAARLSGGEKVVFAIAFRIVVNSLFAGDLGLLCLDEPTAGLDEDSLSCLDSALGRLRVLSESRGLQVIVVTHERGLDHLFDRVIDLAVPPGLS